MTRVQEVELSGNSAVDNMPSSTPCCAWGHRALTVFANPKQSLPSAWGLLWTPVFGAQGRSLTLNAKNTQLHTGLPGESCHLQIETLGASPASVVWGPWTPAIESRKQVLCFSHMLRCVHNSHTVMNLGDKNAWRKKFNIGYRRSL